MYVWNGSLFSKLLICLAVVFGSCIGSKLSHSRFAELNPIQEGKPQEAKSASDELPLWMANPVEKKKGWETCKKCHDQQITVLTQTTHFSSFTTLHKSAKAKSYCKLLGERTVKRSERCIRCHFSPGLSAGGRHKAASGISCESCHGASKDWFDMHNDYGGQFATKESETAEHRQERIESSIENGLRHPSNLYLLARSCYECHMVDDAELVNKTAHPAMTKDFNMVAWSQGKMRHNFLRTENKYNAESDPSRLRVMFVVDIMTRIEFGLRNIANSESGTRHAQSMNATLQLSIKQLRTVNSKVKNEWVAEAVAIVDRLQASGATVESLEASADELSENSFEFGRVAKMSGTGHNLEAIQAMVPGKNEFVR